MYNGKTVVALVPARGGSKGFPNKNLAVLPWGLSLVQQAVTTSVRTELIDRTIISTDSKQIEQQALLAGAESLGLRPQRYATDTASTESVVLDLLDHGLVADILVVVQPTSPVRSGQQLRDLLDLMDRSGAEAATTISKVVEPHPYKLVTLTPDGKTIVPAISGAVPNQRRQDLPIMYRLTGAFYLVLPDALRRYRTLLPNRTVAIVTEAVPNIDTGEDMEYLSFLFARGAINEPVYGS